METSDAVVALGALAQETRLEIFRLLVRAGTDGLPAGQIAARLKLPAATLSFHLNQLRQAGLVRFRRDGRSLIYATEYATMSGLVGFLTENCCQGGGTCDVDTPAPPTAATTRRGARSHAVSARARRR